MNLVHYNRLQPLIGLAAVLFSASIASAHDHLEAGVASGDPGSPLVLINEADFGGAFGFVFSLDGGDPGSPYDGYYYMNDLVFVAQAATPDFGGPEPGSAGLGTQVAVQLLGVDGPSGSHFGFWETAVDEVDSTQLTWSLSVPFSNGTNLIQVTQSAPSPTSDPYGHLHGRIYSVDVPGFYATTWRFVDVSTNGPGGGPVQAPSEPFVLYFQADFTIAAIQPRKDTADIVFAAPSNIPDSGIGPATLYTLESSTQMGTDAVWTSVGDVVIGDDHLHTNSVPMGQAKQFFRLTSN